LTQEIYIIESSVIDQYAISPFGTGTGKL